MTKFVGGRLCCCWSWWPGQQYRRKTRGEGGDGTGQLDLDLCLKYNKSRPALIHKVHQTP